MLSLNDLEGMEPGVFASGLSSLEVPNTERPGKRKEKIRWVAVRGDVADWAVYTSLNFRGRKFSHWQLSPEYVAKWGGKLHDLEEIQKLVPSTPEALAAYRH